MQAPRDLVQTAREMTAAEARSTDNGGNAHPPEACPPNGSDAKLHGQGPRAEARAARGAPACEARDARRVPP
jgi:hypothetical protein